MKPLIIASTLALALLAQYLLGCTDIYIYDVPVYQGEDFTDTGVGCIDDCLDPMEEST